MISITERLEDKPSRVALVTGGRRGLGAAMSKALSAAGFDIAIADLVHDDDANETLQVIRSAGGRAAFFEADIADIDRHDALLDQVQTSLGAVECLVNNAGISVETRGDLLDVTPASFDRLIDVNLRGTFFLSQKLARRFVRGNASREWFRSIINISSANAFLVATNRAEYCISKAAITTLTKLFAARLAEFEIPVYEVRPGIFQTKMTEVARNDYDTKIDQGFSPIARWGREEELAKAVVSLATGCLPFSTGEAIHIDGGLHIHRV
ncbi:3-ketoacyl-ACP reductase [Caballeronia grimmiae]|uniref:3-ketoacyl-ACP reductase n=1 Tax=Caballeronia grimmiae TaxID=1071679 RepID=UPI0038B95AD0